MDKHGKIHTYWEDETGDHKNKIAWRFKPYKHLEVVKGEGKGIWITDVKEDSKHAYEWIVTGEKRVWFPNKEFVDITFKKDGSIAGTNKGKWEFTEANGIRAKWYDEDDKARQTTAEWRFDGFWHLEIVEGDMKGSWILDADDKEDVPEEKGFEDEDAWQNTFDFMTTG